MVTHTFPFKRRQRKHEHKCTFDACHFFLSCMCSNISSCVLSAWFVAFLTVSVWFCSLSTSSIQPSPKGKKTKNMSSFQLSFLIQFWKRICAQTNLCDWLLAQKPSRDSFWICHLKKKKKRLSILRRHNAARLLHNKWEAVLPANCNQRIFERKLRGSTHKQILYYSNIDWTIFLTFTKNWHSCDSLRQWGASLYIRTSILYCPQVAKAQTPQGATQHAVRCKICS